MTQLLRLEPAHLQVDFAHRHGVEGSTVSRRGKIHLHGKAERDYLTDRPVKGRDDATLPIRSAVDANGLAIRNGIPGRNKILLDLRTLSLPRSPLFSP